MPYKTFDRSKLKLRPLNQREHDLTVDQIPALNAPIPPFDNPNLPIVADRIVRARQNNRAVNIHDRCTRHSRRCRALSHRPDGTRPHHPYCGQWRLCHTRLRICPHRRNPPKAWADISAPENLDCGPKPATSTSLPKQRRKKALDWAKRSDATSSKAITHTKTSAFMPLLSDATSPSPHTSASVMTSSTNTPTATVPQLAQAPTPTS